MDIALHGYYYRLKRYWRRKKYQRLTQDETTSMAPKRKLKVVRLRSKKRQNFIKIRKAPKLRFMFILPLKMVAKFHKAYVNLAAGDPTAGNKTIENNNNSKVHKSRPMPMMLSGSNSNQAMVDVRMVMELYNRAYDRSLKVTD